MTRILGLAAHLVGYTLLFYYNTSVVFAEAPGVAELLIMKSSPVVTSETVVAPTPVPDQANLIVVHQKESGNFWPSTVSAFLSFWNYELTSVDNSSITLGKVIIALILILLGLYLSRILSRKLAQKLLPRFGIAHGAVLAIQTISFYFLLAFFLLFALRLVHIPLTVFTILGGAIAIGVGFGSQNVVSNFISGLILLVEQPIRIGDIIEFGGLRGNVKRIGARSTILSTPENLEVIVPNSALLESNIVNWTLADNQIRRSLTLGVAYGSATREVADLMLRAVEEHGKVLKSPPVEVLFRNFGDSALEFEVRFWITITRFSEALTIESDIRHRIDLLFKAAGIVIAFPQRDVHLDVKAPLEVRLVHGSELAKNQNVELEE
ncbi:MAG: mechanosensitive ion channel [Bdellovibrionales bacterium]|nr:mechanosensitive ion channel [Bdellovibrionales bacterium]